jgi:hypothetical protein
VSAAWLHVAPCAEFINLIKLNYECDIGRLFT